MRLYSYRWSDFLLQNVVGDLNTQLVFLKNTNRTIPFLTLSVMLKSKISGLKRQYWRISNCSDYLFRLLSYWCSNNQLDYKSPLQATNDFILLIMVNTYHRWIHHVKVTKYQTNVFIGFVSLLVWIFFIKLIYLINVYIIYFFLSAKDQQFEYKPEHI